MNKAFNWKTTIGGALTALGQVFISTSSPTLWWIGKIFLALGPVILGSSAIDSKNVKDDAKH